MVAQRVRQLREDRSEVVVGGGGVQRREGYRVRAAGHDGIGIEIDGLDRRVLFRDSREAESSIIAPVLVVGVEDG